MNRSRKGQGEQAIPSQKDGCNETVEKRDKSRSPLRQSIRNLLSTLRKGATKSSEVTTAAKAVYTHAPAVLVGEYPSQLPEKDGSIVAHLRNSKNALHSQQANDSVTIGRPPYPSCTPQVSSDGYINVNFSGPIWHWSTLSGTGPAWDHCKGVIQDRKLNVTWFSPGDAVHLVLEVDLSRCINVRTLTNGDLSEAELAALSQQEDTRDLKIFELVSQSREKDKFAVRNLGERAAWISALWYEAIHKSASQSLIGITRDSIILTEVTVHRSLGSQVHTSVEDVILPRPATVTQDPRRERSLPPLPPQTPRALPRLTIPPTSLTSQVDKMLRIDSERTPSSSVYSPGSPLPSGLRALTTSPSIANLGQRFMVKQRLAELQKLNDIQHTGSPISKRASESPLSSLSPTITSGTGRSGFLSVLTSEEDEEHTGCDLDAGRVPFEHLRESDFIPRSQACGTAERDCAGIQIKERPVLERNESNRSELPYVSDETDQQSSIRECLKPISSELSVIKTCSVTRIPASPIATKTDISALKEHFDEALSAQKTSMIDSVPAARNANDLPTIIAEKLSKINTLIENDNGQRALQVQQQTDSVRYLNELNAWLENFVKGGTAQINGLAKSVEQLCKDLDRGQESQGGGILSDIYATLSEIRGRTDTSELQFVVSRLTETVNASTQNTMNMQALANFIERQRQEQESFLRTFTSEISGEIKGERLRFVEAMKEATTINVQMQVDQLKRELAPQVVAVTQELGRLETEKREMETKIANLHAFHANQRQNSGEVGD
ncbi:hypothetical protein AN958_03050 [Leucoagaricus sp. SymC.cos]|nr:hypothetical protein AN958_03050 [Leucoagaricus sp. SymC.cos]